jgi:hypothetical protein
MPAAGDDNGTAVRMNAQAWPAAGRITQGRHHAVGESDHQGPARDRELRRVQPLGHPPHPDLSENLTIVIEVADSIDRIDAVLPTLDAMMLTVEPIHTIADRTSDDPGDAGR